MTSHSYYEYLEFDGERFFTAVLLPQSEGAFPTVIIRSPYVSDQKEKSEESILSALLAGYKIWLDRGYAVVSQHCRGQGKSTGAFIPYVHEREDGLFLRRWIREQSFYNGEFYLVGGSYTSSLHYETAPFESDVKGAVLEIQDCERYRLWYRNGQMRKGHANWHFGLYKDKCGLNKTHSMASFSQLPLKGLSQRVLGDCAEDFEQMLEAEDPSSPFWSTRNGGCDTRGAVRDANIPVLLTTGYNDFYVGGVFNMWNSMERSTREISALLVSPYDHGDGYVHGRSIRFPLGRRSESFGNYAVDWLDHIRLGTPIPFEKGVITYYRAFEDGWASDFYARQTADLNIPLGEGEASFVYDPADPPAFPPEGFLKDGAERGDVLTVYTPVFDSDVFIKGKMRAHLTVRSDAQDTAFYVNVSVQKPEGYYTLRHDITSLCYQLGDYTPGSEVELDFEFDEHAFLVRTGERLRVDISSTDDNTYVCHTNNKGKYYLQTDTRTATNTVCLDRSRIILPCEVS